MAEIANTLWYRLGTISATDGSTKVTGVGTHFTTAGINPGATLRIDGRFYAYEVKRVVSDTELELATPYYGGNVSAASYSIDRNFQSTTNAKLAADVTDLIGIYEQVRNGTMLTIEGKSAYQVAVANGFKGTESEWLESLKAAGEWSTLNDRTNILTYNNAAAHNSIYRGKNLGTAITASQIQAIRNRTFADLYVGDYWTLPIDGTTTAYIAGLNLNFSYWGKQHAVVLFFNANWKFNINDTDTIEGHLYNSKMYNVHLPYILDKIREVIPDENILTPPGEQVADSVDSAGKVNHRIAVPDIKIFLPSYKNFFGVEVEAMRNAYYTVSHRSWPISHYNQYIASNQTWLDSSTGTNSWSFIVDNGNRYYSQRPTFTLYVRPYIFLG